MAALILVVDDDPVQRRLLETAISRSGMQVVTAPGGQPALDLINGPRGEQITPHTERCPEMVEAAQVPAVAEMKPDVANAMTTARREMVFIWISENQFQNCASLGKMPLRRTTLPTLPRPGILIG